MSHFAARLDRFHPFRSASSRLLQLRHQNVQQLLRKERKAEFGQSCVLKQLRNPPPLAKIPLSGTGCQGPDPCAGPGTAAIGWSHSPLAAAAAGCSSSCLAHSHPVPLDGRSELVERLNRMRRLIDPDSPIAREERLCAPKPPKHAIGLSNGQRPDWWSSGRHWRGPQSREQRKKRAANRQKELHSGMVIPWSAARLSSSRTLWRQTQLGSVAARN